MTNETMRKFGYPGSLLREFDHWVVLLRPVQVTLGSLVLAAKSEATAFGGLPAAAYAELSQVTAQVEATLKGAINYQKINYLMLMMVDPHVHYHVIPRYQGGRSIGSLTLVDSGWPGPPDLKAGVALDAETADRVKHRLSNNWSTIC
ncbi:MAG TPA: HIT family protein [Sphingomicrobium sp.]|nr:HIT family protein [Sphingomicrobium sp.]